MHTLQNELTQFVIENFLFGKANGFCSDDSFLEKGIIDSTGMVELIYHLENTYDITIEDSELVPENLDSVNRLAAFVEKKTTAAQAGSYRSAS